MKVEFSITYDYFIYNWLFLLTIIWLGTVDPSRGSANQRLDDGLETHHVTPRRQAKVTICPRSDHEEDPGVVYKVLVLGSQGVGKTTLTQQLLTSEYLPNSDNYAGLWRHIFV